MINEFLNKEVEYFWEYEHDFGVKFLKSIFQDNYKRKYSMVGDGIYNLVFCEDKLYEVDFKRGTSLLSNDGKKAFKDSTKDIVVEKISKVLEEHNIEYTINSGKFITFKIGDYIAKVEIIKKSAMPQ
jgi:hypothetical protein